VRGPWIALGIAAAFSFAASVASFSRLVVAAPAV
jgi:DHA2 family multidrug resistance protein-like MFS transporter